MRTPPLRDGSPVYIDGGPWAGHVGEVRRIFLNAADGLIFCEVRVVDADGGQVVEVIERAALEPAY
jgi:hypothetical protein